MRKTLLIFSILMLMLATSIMATSNFNITIYRDDNATAYTTLNWTCTLINASAYSKAITATAGVYSGVVNATFQDLVCLNGVETAKRYRFAIDDVNLTNNLALNVSVTLFNLTETHTSGTTYAQNADITYVLSTTHSGKAGSSAVTMLNYVTPGTTLTSGCVTQTVQRNFNVSQTQNISASLDLTGCSLGGYYVDMGVFDSNLAWWRNSLDKTGTGSLYVYRREAITVTDSTTSLIAEDTLEGMPQMGTDLGDFLGNLAPGLGKFLLIMSIFVGVGAIIFGIVAGIGFIVKKVKFGATVNK